MEFNFKSQMPLQICHPHTFIFSFNNAKMVSLSSLLLILLASTALANNPDCLSDKEANTFAKKWLSIWCTGYLTKVSQLDSLVTKGVRSYDGTYGQATIGIDALFASATYVDPLVTNVVQVPEWVFHDCDQIAVRWSYTAVSTGVGSYVHPIHRGPT